MLKQIFSDQILSSVTEVKAQKLTGFLPMVGRKYDRRLMVVGRATNGWISGITPGELRIEARRQDYADDVYQQSTKMMGTECPMSWVSSSWGSSNGYNTRRSAFWRVIRDVVYRLNIANADDDQDAWPSYLVWSNLYKVAPAEGGNPNNELCDAQFAGCARLLRWELENYQPHRLLFLAGRAWADSFLENVWKDDDTSNGSSFVERVGHVACGHHTAHCVVAKHPQGKNESLWVKEVAAAFA